MKNKGIVVSGGGFNAKNVAVGDNSSISINSTTKKEVSLSDNNYPQNHQWKLELSEGKLREVISSMLEYYKEKNDKAILNAIIMQSALLNQLEMQETLNVISQEQMRIDRAKIMNSILHLIDNFAE